MVSIFEVNCLFSGMELLNFKSCVLKPAVNKPSWSIGFGMLRCSNHVIGSGVAKNDPLSAGEMKYLKTLEVLVFRSILVEGKLARTVMYCVNWPLFKHP